MARPARDQPSGPGFGKHAEPADPAPRMRGETPDQPSGPGFGKHAEPADPAPRMRGETPDQPCTPSKSSTTRPVIRPSRRSSRLRHASAAGLTSIGGGAIVPDCASATTSFSSRRLPT